MVHTNEALPCWMMAYIHPKYQGWNDNLPLPITKEMNIAWMKEMKEMMKVNYYELNPARIAITDNADVVDYFYSVKATYTRGDKKESKEAGGKNVEFYNKEGGKLLLLGDMTTQDNASE